VANNSVSTNRSASGGLSGARGKVTMEICRGYTSVKWRTELRPKLQRGDESAWLEAINIFERRMIERFFRCVDLLLRADKADPEGGQAVPGFAIMALCCLLIDTLQAFYTGGHTTSPSPNPCTFPRGKCALQPSTARAFKDFLANSTHFNKDFHNKDVRGDFAVNVRNALLHAAETRAGWRIERTAPREAIVSGTKGNYVLNRTNFYKALTAEFEDYLGRLRNPTSIALRNSFLAQMDAIAKTEPGIN
jgi:hypothetical protein